MSEIILSVHDKKLLFQYAQNAPNIEVCALLFGKGNKVKHIFLTDNIEKSPVHFTISSEQLIEGYKIAEDKKMDVIGIFHSHPHNQAYPSNTDFKFMLLDKEYVWIIYSGIDKKFMAWTIEDKPETRIGEDIYEVQIDWSENNLSNVSCAETSIKGILQQHKNIYGQVLGMGSK